MPPDPPGKKTPASSVSTVVKEEEPTLATKKSRVSPEAPRPKPPFKKRVLPFLWKWTKRLAVTMLVLAVLGFIGIALVVRHYEADLPSVADLKGNYHRGIL